ncbi:MAG: bifunctional phosphopantothenoylcysteine decarboxylase/phosphopantothenate--cysteine ligase CoaBC [Oligoflexia bacterium]|nr:bifunctional phosphopantothenoylcysteine decarboxylase/phosphopantothenate--cysteine ligase CoaBC [Oligoflexia bacterium]
MSGVSENRNIVLGITGSIAAYKAAELARLFVSRGYTVRTIMTQSAQEFITPLTLQSVTGNVVMTDFWESAQPQNIEHIEIADWAHAIVVAPATADLVARMAHGLADTPLLATLLATRAPIVLAPAMNVNMFEHAATQENITVLRKRGIHFVDPEEGALACGWNGTGRLADPWEIFYNVRRYLAKGDMTGKRVLISTGPTREPIDPVRFISNRSSGKMGVALAQEAFVRGADVTLVHGPVSVKKVPDSVRRIPVTTAVEMHAAVLQEYGAEPYDVVIMAAAVADYRPKYVAEDKIKRREFKDRIEMVENPDILLDLGKQRKDSKRPVLVGFAVETGEIDELLEQARDKMKRKQTDLIIGNFASDAFDLDTNHVWMLDRTGRQEEVATTFKSRVANRILDAVLRL